MSPYTVRQALETTSIPVGDLPEDKLTTGQGLMQVDKLDFHAFNLLPPYWNETKQSCNYTMYLCFIIGHMNISRSPRAFLVFFIK